MADKDNANTLRTFGLDLIGEVPWGTHFCQFYATKEDLIEILVPYFAEGLRNNEFCMWITSPPLNAKQAKEALRKAVPELADYVRKGQIEILPYTEWYLLNGGFDMYRVLEGWVEKEKGALSRGFDGLRITGNTFWVERSLWKSFTDYEAAINDVITSHRIIALCTYPLKKCTGTGIVDVVKNHVGTLIRKEKDWYLVEDVAHRKGAEQELFDTLEASHRRQAEISALLGASKAVLVHRDFSMAARSIFGSCKDLLGATAGYVALLSRDEVKNEVLFLDSGGLPCSVDPSLPMPIRGLRAEAYRTGKVVYCNDFPSSEWSNLMPKGHVLLKNVLFAPLTIDNKTVGIMGLANKHDGFTERDAQMSSAFGEIASVALINSQMLEKLKENEKLLKAHSERLEEMVEEKTKQLRNAERLSAIGETAGMVGHDIRNPLQAIIGELYLAKGELASLTDGDAKESLKDTVEAIEEQVTYINKIVTDLQDYAKPLAPCFEDTDLDKIVQSVLPTIFIPEAVEVAYSIEDDFPKLMIDPAYMRRMLTNLISNAVQAMPDGGKLTIHAYHTDNKAFIKVEDTGEGIPEEAKSKVFKPLFTTKAKGQGFGLAVVKKLTDALGGTITFESQKGKGTAFTIELPLRA